MGTFFIENTSQVGSNGPENNTGYCGCFGFSPELDCKIILLKLQYLLVAGHRDINLKLTCPENFILGNFDSARRYYAGHWERKTISVITHNEL